MMFDRTSPIPEPMLQLLEIFSEQLLEVRFGDIDKAMLQEAAARVQQAAQTHAEAELALQAARVDLAEAQQALLAKGQRALAYARIYAETSPELLSRLQAISVSHNTANEHHGSEVERKLARRKPRKNATDQMPKLPGTLAEAETISAS